MRTFDIDAGAGNDSVSVDVAYPTDPVQGAVGAGNDQLDLNLRITYTGTIPIDLSRAEVFGDDGNDATARKTVRRQLQKVQPLAPPS